MPVNSRGAVDLADIAVALKSAQAYELTHQYSDKDYNDQAIHHTLGTRPEQAAPGNHSHSSFPTTWNTFAILVNFQDQNANDPLWQKCQYSIDTHGFVHLRGLVKNTVILAAAGAYNIATLPTGFRPTLRENFAIARLHNAGDQRVDRLDIEVNGNITVRPNTATIANSDYYSLSGITFSTIV